MPVAAILNGVLATLRDHSVDVVVFDEESAAASPSPLLATLPLTQRLDGLIVMGLPLNESVANRLRSLAMPTVLLDTADPRFDSVHCDDYAGGRLVAEHLLGKSHTAFAFIGEAQRSHLYLSPSERRLHGYRAALGDGGHSLPDSSVSTTRHGTRPAHERAYELLARSDHASAVFAHDDVLAAGVLRAARDLGLSVLADVAVVGYDDGELAEALDLTTVRQPLEESGSVAANLLMDRLGGGTSSTRDVDLRLTITERGTT